MNKRTLVLLMAVAASYGPALAAEARDPRDIFESRWRGAWVVTRAPTASECNGIYADNIVSGTSVQSRARQRFEAGVPAHVDEVKVSASRVTLSLTLAENLYVASPRRDYTLVNTARCQVDLKFPLPPDLAASDNPEAIESLVTPVLDRHASEAQAIQASGFLPMDAEAYEQARRAAIPPHKELMVAGSHEDVIATRLEEWKTRNARITARKSDDPDYKAGFARGVEAGRTVPPAQCAELVKAAPAPYWPTPATAAPAAQGKHNKEWVRGYEDGARLGQGLEVVRVLEACAASPAGGSGR